MVMIEVDEKKLDAVVERSLISCYGLHRKFYGDCNHGRTKTPYGESNICAWCVFGNERSIKEWLKEEG